MLNLIEKFYNKNSLITEIQLGGNLHTNFFKDKNLCNKINTYLNDERFLKNGWIIKYGYYKDMPIIENFENKRNSIFYILDLKNNKIAYGCKIQISFDGIATQKLVYRDQENDSLKGISSYMFFNIFLEKYIMMSDITQSKIGKETWEKYYIPEAFNRNYFVYLHKDGKTIQIQNIEDFKQMCLTTETSPWDGSTETYLLISKEKF